MIKQTKPWIFAAMLGIATTAAAQPKGQPSTYPVPDPAWGTAGNGVAWLGFDIGGAQRDYAAAALLLPTGHLLMAGTAQTGDLTVPPWGEYQLAFAQLSGSHGDPDPTFGTLGGSTLPIEGEVREVARTADGHLIYVADAYGTVDAETMTMTIGRLNADGSPDTSFDFDGHRFVAASAILAGANSIFAEGILAQADGSLLALVYAASTESACSGVIRLLSDGSFDPNFGNSSGIACVAPAFGTEPRVSASKDFKRLADGRILLGGIAYHTGGSAADMAVARLHADGTLDASFGTDGWAFVGFDQGGPLTDIANELEVDTTGRIVLAGVINVTDTQTALALARLHANGQLDTSFGTQGRLVLANHAFLANGLTVMPDGGLLVGAIGSTSMAVRLTATGLLDPWFGINGTFTQAFGSTEPSDKVGASDTFLDGDYLYMVGEGENVDTGSQDFAAARFILPLFSSGFEAPANLN